MDGLAALSGIASVDPLHDPDSRAIEEPDSRGRVPVRQVPFAQGEPGPGVDARRPVPGAGGGTPSAADALITRLSDRTGKAPVRLTRGEDALGTSAKGVGMLCPAALRGPGTGIARQSDGPATVGDDQ